MIKRTLPTIILFWSFCHTFAQSPNWETLSLDSLRVMVKTTEGDDKLMAYQYLLLNLMAENNPDEQYHYYQEYMREAHKQGDLMREANARANILGFFNNQSMFDSLLHYFPEYTDFMARHKQWRLYFFSHNLLVAKRVARGEYAEALKEMQAVYDFSVANNLSYGQGYALSQIGRVYCDMGRNEEGIRDLKAAIVLLKKESEKEALFETYDCLASFYEKNQRYNEQLSVLKEYETELNLADPVHDLYPVERYYMERGYAHCYISMGNIKEAERHYQLAAGSPIADTYHIQVELNEIRIRLMEANGQYTEALALIDDIIPYFRETDDKGGVINRLSERIRIAEKDGNHRLAFQALTERSALQDSIRFAEVNAQLDELRTRYEVDKLTLEREKQRIYTIALATGCLMLFAVLAGIIVYNRRLKAKNLALYRQIQEQTHLVHRKETVGPGETTTKPSRDEQLFAALEALMQSEQLFTDPTLDRKALADRLLTNERYLADAIRTLTGETFSSYLSRLRLQYAIDLLDRGDETTLESIAEQSGHATYSPFYRAFSKRYGMTPQKYRKMAQSKG